MELEQLKFLSTDQVRNIASEFGTPLYVYSQQEIEKRCDIALSFPNEYGLIARYAMKANPNSTILKIMRRKGIHIDASSIYEVERALAIGFKPEEIMLTSQELSPNLKSIVEKGVFYNACSLHQLEAYGKLFAGKEVSIRINPGLGSGSTQKTDVGGATSSFGIWFEYMDEVKKIREKYNLKITKVHTHIGSGSDPEVWRAVSRYTLEYAEMFPECVTVNLGGGFKVGRMLDEKTTDLQKIGQPVKELFIEFYKKHGRKLKLEIEPGTHMMALCGSIISRIVDKVNTGSKGFEFIKLDTGMDSNTRPSLYGSRHPLITVAANGDTPINTKEYVVVGHCCESGDIFTQKEGGAPESRTMHEANIGDFIVMEGTGAYCAGMSTKNYNSYPETAEVLLQSNGKSVLMRKRQELTQIMQNEIQIDLSR